MGDTSVLRRKPTRAAQRDAWNPLWGHKQVRVHKQVRAAQVLALSDARSFAVRTSGSEHVMTLQDDVRAVQRSLDDLVRLLGGLERQLGSGPEIRRVRADADRLRESLALLREGVPDAVNRSGPDIVPIPDTPYDTHLWASAEDMDDEGIGARDRHAP